SFRDDGRWRFCTHAVRRALAGGKFIAFCNAASFLAGRNKCLMGQDQGQGGRWGFRICKTLRETLADGKTETSCAGQSCETRAAFLKYIKRLAYRWQVTTMQ